MGVEVAHVACVEIVRMSRDERMVAANVAVFVRVQEGARFMMRQGRRIQPTRMKGGAAPDARIAP